MQVGDTRQLQTEEPCASSWQTQDPDDRNYIYRDQQNRIRYEKYGDRNYRYDPYRAYYTTDGPQINPTPVEPREMEITPPNPNQPIRKPPGFEKRNVEPKENRRST